MKTSPIGYCQELCTENCATGGELCDDVVQLQDYMYLVSSDIQPV